MDKKMKAAACAAAVLGMAFMAGCGGEKEAPKTESAAQGGLVQQIKEKGQLVVGTASGYPPYEFIDTTKGDKTVIGIDMELAKAVADKLGVKLVIQDMNFQSLLSSLASGKVDLAISGINPTDERRKTMDFSDVYLPTEQVVMIRKADADKYKKLEDLYGKKIAVQKSTTQEILTKAEIKDAQIVGLAHVPEAVLELKHGKADLMFAEGIHFKNGTKDSAAALRKGSGDLLKVVNEAIKENTENGNFKKWEEEYIQKSVDNAAK